VRAEFFMWPTRVIKCVCLIWLKFRIDCKDVSSTANREIIPRIKHDQSSDFDGKSNFDMMRYWQIPPNYEDYMTINYSPSNKRGRIIPELDERSSFRAIKYGTYNPCSTGKWRIHRIYPIALLMPTSTVSVVFFFSLCLHDDNTLQLFQLWCIYLISGCTTYELSIHHCGLSYISFVYVSSFLPLMYCIKTVRLL